ncbi:MAG: hypothetical protein JO307_19405 [Bryobacterales bacterium]|nr:hypothetical protein [Bryobacterales bacterium]
MIAFQREESKPYADDGITEKMSHPDAISTFGNCELARERPQLFTAAVGEYCAVVQLAVEESVAGTDRHTLAKVRSLARRLGDADSLPQDVIAIHLSALAMLVRNKPHGMAKACVRHSRLLLVKMVGELALFYREQARAGVR